MKIISHRGAAGLALENTLASVRAGIESGADAIEIDVRLTADGSFVLCHDSSLRRVGGSSRRICDQTLHEILSQQLKNGEPPATLEEVLKLSRNTTLLVEAKGDKWASALATIIRTHVSQHIIVIALNVTELAKFSQLSPNTETYLVERFNPVDFMQALRDARTYGFTGIDMNFWLLNPLTYWLANRYKLTVVVYTVNWLWIARFLRRLFPDVIITTDRPHIVKQ